MGVFTIWAKQKTDSKQGSEAIKPIMPALSYHIYIPVGGINLS